ncbi:unnamed protein product [Gongylonema pulchrum]|uniref:Protein kinase domain-containing protein n=1 Tax=Gongylonema pulchrum TaxID=637853 RepID=A0A183E6Q1_9BILA|nr:unnamed protein product [Gongylonema pulchrum]
MILRRQLFPGKDAVSQVKMIVYYLGTPEQLMMIAPWKRLTAEQALCHPYLDMYHDPKTEPICSKKVYFDAEAIEQLGVEELKQELLNEVTRFDENHSAEK